MRYGLKYSGARFLSTEIKITQYPNGIKSPELHSRNFGTPF